MRVFFCATVDCDLRVSAAAVRDRALWTLLEVFGEQGVAGHATWYLNENDFAVTYLHPEFVREAVSRGDTIGVHDHVDFLAGAWEYEPLREFCARSLARVGAGLERLGGGAPTHHRFGCLWQRPVAYRVLVDLGYAVSSDVCPGTDHRNHTGELSFDNRAVPLGVLPYRHGSDNVTDWRSASGPMLQVPMLKATLTAKFWPRLDRDCLEAWLAAARQRGQDRAVLNFGFHPYEIVDQARLALDAGAAARLGELLALVRDEYGATFASLDEVAALGPESPA